MQCNIEELVVLYLLCKIYEVMYQISQKLYLPYGWGWFGVPKSLCLVSIYVSCTDFMILNKLIVISRH